MVLNQGLFYSPPQPYSDLSSWSLQSLYQTKIPTFAISDLTPGTWYQLRVTATNEAGSVTTTYSYATKNEDGSKFDLENINIFFKYVSYFYGRKSPNL